ncbi:MAG: hypothetical protein KJ061_13460 [Vicinamibacteraceae bacterium]|nr:hypothetical protein [Vicinamibacteraceae bacterium]
MVSPLRSRGVRSPSARAPLALAPALVLALSLGLAQIPRPTLAQSIDPDGGLLRAKVTDALNAVARGACPEELMAPLLLDACEMQLPRMKPHLAGLGPIERLRFRGIEQMPNGVEAEVYRVVFRSGQMTWAAAAGPNGKLVVLFSPG